MSQKGMASPPKIVVLTGAGISRESGLSTYRDRDGTWAKVPLEQVAHIRYGFEQGLVWRRNREPAITVRGQIYDSRIQAPTVTAEVLIEKKTLGACRETGQQRLEGKNYIVQDGDVIEIRANA